MVNELKSNKNRNLADDIEPQEWCDLFKKLNKPQSAINERDKVIDSIIKRATDFALPDSSSDKPSFQNFGKLITSLQFSKAMMSSIPITTGVLQLAVALVNHSLSLSIRDRLKFWISETLCPIFRLDVERDIEHQIMYSF